MDRAVSDRYMEKLNDALVRMGGVYSVSDLADRVERGDMQCFISGNSFGLTEVIQFPQRLVVDILCVVGDLPDCLKIHDQIVEFAVSKGATLLRAQARPGWYRLARDRGWRPVNIAYYKDL